MARSFAARSPRHLLLLAALLALTSLSGVQAQDTAADYGLPVLEGRAVLPADTFVEGPGVGTAIDPASNLNGRTLPFEGQPVQGFSALIPAENGNWYGLSDNGYGARANSSDYNLRWYEVNANFDEGTVEVIGFTELSDPDRLVPFAIVNDDTEDRVLTGADFDVESFRQVSDGTFWLGEEFGPYLLHVDAEGRLLEAPIPTSYSADLADFARGLDYIQSPQNPDFVDLADDDARIAAANLGRSKGFEGLALNTSGTILYPLLEGALLDDTDRTRLLIQAFDLESESYTGDYWFYPMSSATNAIGEMTAINDSQLIVIERDGGQGAAAAFKRLYLVDLNDVADDGHTLRKTLIADLLGIYDPNGITVPEAGANGLGPIFRFPFETIESVYPVDEDTLILVDDNNYPFSNGRRAGTPDDNEFILITLPQPLELAQ
jgi:hypothetical protein